LGKNNSKQSLLLAYAQIALGTFALALAITMCFEPYDLVFGGATGLGIIIRSFGLTQFGIEIPLWLTNLAINTPLFLLAAKVKGFRFLARTGVATALLSLFLYLTGMLPLIDLGGQLPLAAVFGGALGGFGIGLVFRNMATTGGSDLLSMILRHYHRHMQLSGLMLMIDAAVILLGFFIFGPVKALYAIAAVFTSSRAISMVLDGLSFAKAAFVISSNADAVSKALLASLHRGATIMDARGKMSSSAWFRRRKLCI